MDLSNVPKGIAVNLSFDLIGFGANDSHVTLNDVRVSGLPQLHDDTATMLEDGTLAFDPFALINAPSDGTTSQSTSPSNGDGQVAGYPAGGGLGWGSVFGSKVVGAPAHGAITVNADGTFIYTPNANYNGTDSFSYQLNDGTLYSNIATVSLTVTSVNDAPQGTNATVTTLEDTPYVFRVSDFGFSDLADAGSNAGANNFVAAKAKKQKRGQIYLPLSQAQPTERKHKICRSCRTNNWAAD